jgi:hypothetical protein
MKTQRRLHIKLEDALRGSEDSTPTCIGTVSIEVHEK